jgi:hypothetical protein
MLLTVSAFRLFLKVLTCSTDRIRRKRPELRVIISSATIDAQAFLSYFNANTVSGQDEAAILSLEGRMYPVELAYLAQPTLNYVETAVEAVFDIHLNVSVYWSQSYIQRPTEGHHFTATPWRSAGVLDGSRGD